MIVRPVSGVIWMYLIRKSLELAKCSSSGLVRGRAYKWIISFFFLKKKKKKTKTKTKKLPLDPGASGLYIVSQNAFRFYIWRVRIRLSWYLSHQGLTRRFYTKMWAVWALFIVIFPLIRLAKWLQCISRRGDDCFILPFSTLRLRRTPFNSDSRLSEVK